jgi:hypothetical protein
MSTPGVSQRRSACDRCRGQKLRCLKDSADPKGRCDRCAKVDAQCLTSPIYRMRNYSVEDHNLATASCKRPRQESSTQPARSKTPSSTLFNWPCIDIHTFLNLPKPSRASFTSPSHDDVADLTGTTFFDSTPMSNSWDSGNVNVLSANTIARPASPSVGANFTQIDTSASSHGDAQSQGFLWSQHPEEIENLTSSSSDIQTRDPSSDMQSYTEELSRINLNLASQLGRMTKGPPYVDFKTLIALECADPHAASLTTPPLEEILNCTRHYLDIASLISRSQSLSLPVSTDIISADDSDRTRNSSRTSVSHDESTSSSDFCSPTYTQPSDKDRPISQLDSSILLSLLICYIHILRLNVALFLHFQQYLQAISKTDKPAIYPLPGLYGFSDFPLRMPLSILYSNYITKNPQNQATCRQ